MENIDVTVLRALRDWRAAGRQALLAIVTLIVKTVVEWRHEREMKAIAELPPERPA